MKRKSGLKASSKAQTALDTILFIIVIAIFAIAAIFGNLIFKEANAEIQADPDMSAEAKGAANTVNSQFPTMFDKAFLVLLVLFWILLLVSSFMIDTHPVFFAITILLLLFVFVVAMVVSNTYEEIVDDPLISAYADDFPITNWVMSHFLLTIIVIGFTSALALYAKNKI